jgi:hypothetical protein
MGRAATANIEKTSGAAERRKSLLRSQENTFHQVTRISRPTLQAVARVRITKPHEGFRTRVGRPHKKPARQPETTVNSRNQSERQVAGQRPYARETAGQGRGAVQTLNP